MRHYFNRAAQYINQGDFIYWPETGKYRSVKRVVRTPESNVIEFHVRDGRVVKREFGQLVNCCEG